MIEFQNIESLYILLAFEINITSVYNLSGAKRSCTQPFYAS